MCTLGRAVVAAYRWPTATYWVCWTISGKRMGEYRIRSGRSMTLFPLIYSRLVVFDPRLVGSSSYVLANDRRDAGHVVTTSTFWPLG